MLVKNGARIYSGDEFCSLVKVTAARLQAQGGGGDAVAASAATVYGGMGDGGDHGDGDDEEGGGGEVARVALQGLEGVVVLASPSGFRRPSYILALAAGEWCVRGV
jgi:hypothetical protein